MEESYRNEFVECCTRPVEIGLAHELIHADKIMRGYRLNGDSSITYVDSTGKEVVQNWSAEEYSTIGIKCNVPGDITENDIRKEHGLNLRGAY